ncbi:MAG: hypothetical protein M3X11_12955 [Acidobacteriota bacterium]|nr:hypothetical protein [Acidobacteriota bacterium]
MWKNISELLSLVFTFNEKLKHQDNRIDRSERQVHDLAGRVDRLTVDVAQLIERDKNREALFRQAIEIERLKLENERLKTARALPPPQNPEDQP